MGAYRLRGIFSKNLKDVLSRNGITQADLADMMGVSYSSVSAWCTGVKMPRIQKAGKTPKNQPMQHEMQHEKRGRPKPPCF